MMRLIPRVLPYLPFIVLAVAVMVAVYHVNTPH
jgi:hypothetical protein